MVKKIVHAATPATQWLAQHQVAYSEHTFDYIEHGGTEHSSRMMGVPEHAVVKTLVMESETGDPLIVLMHGDRKVSTKELARQANVKKVQPCKPEVATRHSGYLIGGTSPFGTRKRMPVYMEKSIMELPAMYINGGRRGYLLGLPPQTVFDLLKPVLVSVALED